VTTSLRRASVAIAIAIIASGRTFFAARGNKWPAAVESGVASGHSSPEASTGEESEERGRGGEEERLEADF